MQDDKPQKLIIQLDRTIEQIGRVQKLVKLLNAELAATGGVIGKGHPLPCPFCGTPNPHVKPSRGRGGCVQCDACGAIGPDGEDTGDCDGIAAWNRAARWSDVDAAGGTERDGNGGKALGQCGKIVK